MGFQSFMKTVVISVNKKSTIVFYMISTYVPYIDLKPMPVSKLNAARKKRHISLKNSIID